MADRTHGWRPSVDSLLANLETAARGGPVELQVPEVSPTTYVGMDDVGSRWARIVCSPKSVSVDHRTAAISFRVLGDGYLVAVDPAIEKTVAQAFLAEIVALLHAGGPAGSAGVKALQHWRELLARPPGQLLDEKAQAGLYGELEVLTMVLGHGGSFESWTGWQMDQNDFRLPGLVIEVKTTLSPNYRRVRIHGLAQLADPQDGSELILVLRRLERSATGRSLPDIVETCVDQGAPHSQLLEQLASVAYSEQHRGHYVDTKFVSREIALRVIDDDHPRLTPELLAASTDLSCIDRVDYVLDLNGAANADLDTTLDDLLIDRINSK